MNKDKFFTVSNWIVLFTAIITGTVTANFMLEWGGITRTIFPSEILSPKRLALIEQQAIKAEKSSIAATERATQIDQRVKELIETITKPSVPGRPDVRPLQLLVEKVGNQIADVGKQTKSIDTRMTKLETVILADPLKVIELPLMKRDLQNLQNQLERDLKIVREENAKVYDMMKLIVSLMGIVSLGLIGLAVGNLFKGSKL